MEDKEFDNVWAEFISAMHNYYHTYPEHVSASDPAEHVEMIEQTKEECRQFISFLENKGGYVLDGDSADGVRYSQQLLRDTFQKFKRKDGLVKVSKLYNELML